MDDFRPPPGDGSRGKVVHACSHAKDQGKVELDVASGSNAKTSGCIDLAWILMQALKRHEREECAIYVEHEQI